VKSILENIDLALAESDFESEYGVPESVVERYSCGECMWLALALNRRFGWKIRAQMQRDKKHGDYVAHAYVVHPSGQEIDILGPQDHVDVFASDTQDWRAQDLIDFLDVEPSKVRRQIRDAEKTMNRYVIPKLRSKGLIE